MTSAFKCPKCQFGFRVQNRFLGRVAACPKCAQKMRLTPTAAQQSTNSVPPVSTNPDNSRAAVGSDANVSTSSATMTVPRKVPLRTPPQKPISREAVERKVNPGNSRPAAQPDDSVSRVQARRATRKLVRRKLQSTASPPTAVQESKRSVNPLWIGFVAAIVIGLAGWGAYSMMSSTSSESESVVPADDSEDSNEGRGQSGRLANSAVKLVSLPAETRQQIAARKKAEKKAAEDAQHTAELKATIVPYLTNTALIATVLIFRKPASAWTDWLLWINCCRGESRGNVFIAWSMQA